MDAARLGFPAGMFDVILCNNVLPFVLDDAAVLVEIRRCLKPDGVAMVDVAVELPRTTSVTRLVGTGRFTAPYLATNGTQRLYGHDYPRRLRAAGLVPLRFDTLAGLSLRYRRTHGLKLDGRVYLAFGTAAAARAFARSTPAI
jgi:SAM-dependent methyltransferase